MIFSSPLGARRAIVNTTTTTAMTMPTRFHQEKIVSLTGMIVPAASAISLPGVAIASGPDPE